VLAETLIAFVRILRRLGLPVGPGKVALALEALNAIDISHKEDVFAALHAVLVERHHHREVFTLAFERFWRAPKIGQAVPDAFPKLELTGAPTPPALRRVSEAFGQAQSEAQPVIESDIQASWSSSEQLRTRDFEAMSAAEAAEGQAADGGPAPAFTVSAHPAFQTCGPRGAHRHARHPQGHDA
jgi:uncharacterized protein with von Willebrand factor type A (vWA) domain